MNDEHYMRLAIEEAKAAARRGEVPVGAVLVNAGREGDCQNGQCADFNLRSDGPC